MNKFYVALDPMSYTTLFRASTPGGAAIASHDEMAWGVPGAHHWYWNGSARAWFTEIERAEVYTTIEEAESQAVIAVALDARVAGHVEIVPESVALLRENEGIAERRHQKATRTKMANYYTEGHKIGPDEGGVI